MNCSNFWPILFYSFWGKEKNFEKRANYHDARTKRRMGQKQYTDLSIVYIIRTLPTYHDSPPAVSDAIPDMLWTLIVYSLPLIVIRHSALGSHIQPIQVYPLPLMVKVLPP